MPLAGDVITKKVCGIPRRVRITGIPFPGLGSKFRGFVLKEGEASRRRRPSDTIIRFTISGNRRRK